MSRLTEILRAGNDDFWLERGEAARWDTLVGGGWIGGGARLLLVLYGLTFAIVRAASRALALASLSRSRRRRAHLVGRRADRAPTASSATRSTAGHRNRRLARPSPQR